MMTKKVNKERRAPEYWLFTRECVRSRASTSCLSEFPGIQKKLESSICKKLKSNKN